MFGKGHSKTRNNYAPKCSNHLVSAFWTTQHIPAPTLCSSSRNVCRHAGRSGGTVALTKPSSSEEEGAAAWNLSSQISTRPPRLGAWPSSTQEWEAPHQYLGESRGDGGEHPGGRTKAHVSPSRPSSGESDDLLLLLFLHF